jgi:TRAP-type mannitol/chloroaromatic compound transport system permease small subunit
MLATFLLNMVYYLSVGFIGIFPDVSLSDSVSASIGTASTYISGLNVVLPVSTLIAIVGLVLTIEGVILLIKIINWFIRKIPGIN